MDQIAGVGGPLEKPRSHVGRDRANGRQADVLVRNLSETEKRCLRALTEHGGQKAAARALGMNVRTFELHVINARGVFGGSTYGACAAVALVDATVGRF